MFEKNYPHNILVYEPNWLGDILFTTPSLRALKLHFPAATVTCIVPEQFRELLESQPYVDCVIAQNDRSLFDKIRLIQKLRSQKFDMAFLFHRSKTRARILRWAGIPNLHGFNTNRRKALLTHPVKEPKEPLHKMNIWKELLKSYKIPVGVNTYQFDFKEKQVDLPKPYVVLHPGANWGPKRWPETHYGTLAELLSQRKKINIVLTGSTHEKNLAQKISSHLNQQVFDVMGQTSYTELANIFAQSQAVVAGDTGAMHLACASGAKVVALYGPTSPDLNGPEPGQRIKVIWKKSKCQNYPCQQKDCDHDYILTKLTPQTVYKAVVQI